MPHHHHLLPLALCVLPFGALQAYPPAPGLTVSGIVRHEDGWPVDANDAFIIFRSGEAILAKASLNAGVEFSRNYRVLLPLDMDPESGEYKAGVVRPTAPFTVTVEIAGDEFLPVQADISQAQTAQAAGNLTLNFNLGVDSDDDGLPDDWELWQLQSAGISSDSPDYNLAQLSRNGDYDNDGLSDHGEFLAGTFAHLGSDTLELTVLETSPDGWLEMEFLSIFDKAYRFEASTDLKNWANVEVAIDQQQSDLRSSFRSTNTRRMKISAPPSPDGSKRFFRAHVR